MKLKACFKKMSLIVPIIILPIMAYSFEGQADEGKIGEIRYSILTLEQFQELYGPTWELMKGQSISKDSELFHLWGKEELPDARGVYLRSANHGRAPAEGNPHGDSDACGAYLSDNFKSHNHSGISGEDAPDHSHGHGWPGRYGDGGFDKGNKAGAIWDGARTHGASTRHRHSIPAAGGSETRPRSVIVNTYIKVRESTPEAVGRQAVSTSSSSQPLGFTSEMMSVITTRPEFRTAVENAVTEMMNRRNR